MADQLPEHFKQLMGDQAFQFKCHPGVPCFTECCRELDLALSPYDVLRLKNKLKIHSGRFLEEYVIIEWEPGQLFPTCYLTMVDDGKASCIFVKARGCTVYADRPSACRAYPVGRGASQQEDGSIAEHFVLVQEPHCKGFKEDQHLTPEEFIVDQGLESYNLFNDAMTKLLQHQRLKDGFRPSRQQLDQYILALYNLDSFRQEFADGRLTMSRPLSPQELSGLAGDDEALLLLAVDWLIQEFY